MTRNATAAEDAVARLSAVFPRENNQAYEAPVPFACSCFRRIRKERFSGAPAVLPISSSIEIPFPSHHPHCENAHPIFDQMKPVRPAPVSQI